MREPWIGRGIRRLEDPRLLRGAGQFTDDFVLPGQVFAAFVRSPHAHARVSSVETAAARRAAGVVTVLTGSDYLADGGRGIAHLPVPSDVVDYQRPAFVGALDEPQLPLAVDEVRYPGEAVAVVIAESPALAQDAAEQVDVRYEPLPAVTDVRSGTVAVDTQFGNPEATARAIATADVVIERGLRSQRVANAQIEPRAAIGSYDAATDSYLMIAGSQGALRQRASLAAALNIPTERVRVISPDVGGGFGPRTALYPEQVVVTWAARRVGRPVRWTSTRTEAFLTDHQGRETLCRATLALSRDGTIQALTADFVFNVGAYTGSYVPLNNAARILTSVYHVPAASARVRGALTHSVLTGPYRGAGRPETIFVVERLLDMAAVELGMDRLEIRRRNLIRRAQLPYRSPMGLTYDSGDFLGNMERAAELAEWPTFESRRSDARRRGRLAGIGVANYVEAPVGAPHERVELNVLPHGVVEVVVGTQSSGQGHATTFAQVLADQLAVDPECVQLRMGDTREVHGGGGTHSDRSMRLVGALLLEAAAQIHRQVAATAEDQHRPLSIWQAADIVELRAEASFTGRLPAHPTGAAVCEVEVDPDTGSLELTRYVSVDDIGQPINPAIAHGQVHGGIVQGLGQALDERVVLNPETGQVLSSSFADYAIPTAAGLPGFVTELAEDATQGNALRIKGGGESGITPALACVVNAVVDALLALGVQDLEMPLSPASVWHAQAVRGVARVNRFAEIESTESQPLNANSG